MLKVNNLFSYKINETYLLINNSNSKKETSGVYTCFTKLPTENLDTILTEIIVLNTDKIREIKNELDSEITLNCNDDIFSLIFSTFTSQWLFNNEKISKIQFEKSIFKSNSKYLIENINETHDGNYSCHIYYSDQKNWTTSQVNLKMNRKYFDIGFIKKNERLFLNLAFFVLIITIIHLIITIFKNLIKK
jgi:hypothetical protein